MPVDTVATCKSFLVLTAVIVISLYTAYHLLHLRYTHLDEEMSQEDLKYFKDGALMDKIKAGGIQDNGDNAEAPADEREDDDGKFSNKREVKKREAQERDTREASETTTTLMNELDNSHVSSIMSDYNLDYTTTKDGTPITTTALDSSGTSSTTQNQEEVTSKQPQLPLGTVAMMTTTPLPPVGVDQTTPDGGSGGNLSNPPKSTSSPATPATATNYAPSPAPSAPPTKWTSNSHLYTSPEIQKLAQEYFNSVTIKTTSEPAQKKSFSNTPSTSPTPVRTGLDSTKPEDKPPKTSMPKYTTYNIPTTTTLPPPCFRQPYKINQVCSLQEQHLVPRGENVTLEDIAKMVFLKSTLSSLKDSCQPGVWCIEKDLDLQNIEAEYMPFCELKGCLLKMPDECLNEVGIHIWHNMVGLFHECL